jgi:uncharacterized protein YjbI with pentapeptide repeats
MFACRKLFPAVAALALALAGVVIAPQAASADMLLGNCNVVAAPTETNHSECPGADLGQLALNYLDFDWADLSGSVISPASNVSYSTFRHADLSNGTWIYVGLVDVDFTDANLQGINLSTSVAPGANFSGANLQGANLSSGSFSGSSFADADLTNVDFSGVNFTANADPDDFTGATLTGAVFTGTALMPASPAAVQAASGEGAPVAWGAPAKTDPGAQLGDCSAPGLGSVHSGDTFPIGATTVTCQFVSTSNATYGTGQFTVTVDAPADSVSITSAASTAFQVGVGGTFTVTSSGYPAATIQEQGALPAGIGFTDNGDGTATLSGTPQAGAGGTYPLQVIANAGTASDSQTFTLTVDEAPAITSGGSATFVVGTAGSFTVTATGFPAPSVTEAGALPSGVTFVGGVLSGTPDPGTGGTYPVTFAASNGVGADAPQDFTLMVNEGPSIASGDSAVFTVGAEGSFTITSAGVPDAGISADGALPDGVGFVDNGDGTATLSGSPGPATGGTYPLTLTASNGVAADAEQSFTLTVDEAPAITSAGSATFTVGSDGSFTATATGFPAPSISEDGVLPSGVAFADGVFSGAPDPGSGGVYPVTLMASNGVGDNASQDFTLIVDEAPAITSADSATFTVGDAGSFMVISSGVPDAGISEDGALPDGVVFVNNGDGTASLSGTPDPGTGGAYALTLTASNGVGDNASQDFTLTVQEGPAITSADSATFTVGESGSFTITSTGVPDAGISEDGALPGGLTFADNGDGTATLSGTPVPGTGGEYSLTLTASNGVGQDLTQDFTVTVNEAASISSSDTTTLTIGVDQTITVTTSGFPAPTITVSGDLPDGVTFTDNGGGTATLSGRPAAGTSGTYRLTITADNGVGESVTQTFTLTTATTDTTTTLSASGNPVTAGASLTLTATVDPPEGAPTGTVRFLDGSAVLGSATLVANDATSSVAALTITAPSTGTHTIVAVYGGDGAYAGSTSASLTLTVVAAPVTPEPPEASPPASTGLPDTGVDVRPLLSVSFALLLSGGLALALARRRRRA